MCYCFILLYFLIGQGFAFRGHQRSRQGLLRDGGVITTASPWVSLAELPSNSSFNNILKRQTTATTGTTCGYLNGSAAEPRTAGPGWDCRFDTAHGLWGFCPVTVIAATDCGLAGNCVDSHACTSGCGLTGIAGITTFTCPASGDAYCSTALLTEGVDQVYSYIACGAGAAVDHLLATPTSDTSSTAASSSASAAAASNGFNQGGIPTTSALSVSSDLKTTTSSFSGRTITPAPQTGTIISTQSTSSSVSSKSSSGSSNNLGPIIGGIVGSLAVICGFVLGILYLRRQNYSPAPGPEGEMRNRTSWWHGVHRTTAMQTHGLHEIEGNGPMIHEADGDRINEGGWANQHAAEAFVVEKSPAYELGS